MGISKEFSRTDVVRIKQDTFISTMYFKYNLVYTGGKYCPDLKPCSQQSTIHDNDCTSYPTSNKYAQPVNAIKQ